MKYTHDMAAFFEGRDVPPARVARRYDGTTELTWDVDACGARYVRATSSARGEDYVLVARDGRLVESVVLRDRFEIFDWVLSHLQSMAGASLVREPPVAGGEGLA